MLLLLFVVSVKALMGAGVVLSNLAMSVANARVGLRRYHRQLSQPRMIREKNG
jgi:hypothetical protein